MNAAPAARASSASGVGRAWRALLAVAAPQTCAVCGAWILEDDPLCAGCAARLEAIGRVPYCGRCGRSMHPLAMRPDGCSECQREAFWNVGGVARVGAYHPELRGLLVGLKYAGHERNARVLARLMARALGGRPWLADIEALVPVPMHWRRRLVRPCDHARLLTDALAAELGLPVCNAGRRVRHEPSLAAVASRAQRFARIRGCFAPRRFHAARGRTVCIVDNLLASGATVCELSKVLRRAGARKIYAVVAARTVLRGEFQADDGALAAVG